MSCTLEAGSISGIRGIRCILLRCGPSAGRCWWSFCAHLWTQRADVSAAPRLFQRDTVSVRDSEPNAGSEREGGWERGKEGGWWGGASNAAPRPSRLILDCRDNDLNRAETTVQVSQGGARRRRHLPHTALCSRPAPLRQKVSLCRAVRPRGRRDRVGVHAAMVMMMMMVVAATMMMMRRRMIQPQRGVYS